MILGYRLISRHDAPQVNSKFIGVICGKRSPKTGTICRPSLCLGDDWFPKSIRPQTVPLVLNGERYTST